MKVKIGDLVRYTDGDGEDFGLGIVTEKRKQGGHWAYFALKDDHYPVASQTPVEVISVRKR